MCHPKNRIRLYYLYKDTIKNAALLQLFGFVWQLSVICRQKRALLPRLSTLTILLWAGLFPLLLLACQRHSIDRRAQAWAYYRQTQEIQQSILPELALLEQERNQINIQGRALSAEELARVDLINELLARYEQLVRGLRSVDPTEKTRVVLQQQEAQLTAIKAIRQQIRGW